MRIMSKIIDKTKIIQGSGDGYMNCFRCGARMTITECAKNRFQGETLFYGFRVVSWCNECYEIILKEE